MGRQLPTECKHGVIVDGGDFMDSEECKQCEGEYQFREKDGFSFLRGLGAIIGIPAFIATGIVGGWPLAVCIFFLLFANNLSQLRKEGRE